METQTRPSIDAETTGRAVGLLSVPEYRIEGPLKVTGSARYAADRSMPGMLWAKVLGSPFPHARIVSIDVSRARTVPGVRAVLTGNDLRPARLGRKLRDIPVLAWDVVRFVGDRVAAVAAETAEAAEEAIRAISVEYEELPAVFESDDALREGAPILHPNPSEYVYVGGQRPPVPHPNVQGYVLFKKGDEDIERAFAQADHVFEYTFSTPREHHGYIEPHASLVWIDPDGMLHAISTSKAPYNLREELALTTSLDEDQIEVDSRFIGGDFGGKGFSIDEHVCYFLARATNRPIKTVMSYTEELQGVDPRHASTVRLRTGVTSDGRIVAHQSRVVFNGGAYAGAKPMASLIVNGGTATMDSYNVPNSRLEVMSVYTNTMPCGHMRAPGEVQALFAGESHLDMIARELKMDPLEFRIKNAVRGDQTGAAGARIRDPRAVDVLETLKRDSRWGKRPLPANRGRGVALGLRHVGGGQTSVVFKLHADGGIEVLTAVPDQGAGAYPVIHRVASAVLSVDPNRIRVTHGTTHTGPRDAGAGGSRVTHIVGQATLQGATQLKQQLEELAAEVMGWPAGQVRLEGDRFKVGDGSGEARFEDVAERVARDAPLEVVSNYNGRRGHDEPGDFNFSACMVEVEVDRDTGRLTVTDALVVVDVGTIINPLAHQGQIEGGFVFGLGAGVMEELLVQDGKVATPSLAEYKLPTVADAPRVRTVLLGAQLGPGPFGAKMAGELTNTIVAPAVANAVHDAVGVRITSLPITAEKVFAALK